MIEILKVCTFLDPLLHVKDTVEVIDLNPVSAKYWENLALAKILKVVPSICCLT